MNLNTEIKRSTRCIVQNDSKVFISDLQVSFHLELILMLHWPMLQFCGFAYFSGTIINGRLYFFMIVRCTCLSKRFHLTLNFFLNDIFTNKKKINQYKSFLFSFKYFTILFVMQVFMLHRIQIEIKNFISPIMLESWNVSMHIHQMYKCR